MRKKGRGLRLKHAFIRINYPHPSLMGFTNEDKLPNTYAKFVSG